MRNLPQFTFINGPAGSGKSTLAGLICQTSPNIWQDSFAEPIREMLRAVFFPEECFGASTIDFRDGETKRRKLLDLAGLSAKEFDIPVRQAMIDFSESFMKPRFGTDIFGQLCYKRCMEQAHWYDHFVIDDNGFPDEAQYIISQVGAAKCCLIRLSRNGCDFVGDSRSYIDLPGVRRIDIHNPDGGPQVMLGTLQLAFGTL